MKKLFTPLLITWVICLFALIFMLVFGIRNGTFTIFLLTIALTVVLLIPLFKRIGKKIPREKEAEEPITNKDIIKLIATYFLVTAGICSIHLIISHFAVIELDLSIGLFIFLQSIAAAINTLSMLRKKKKQSLNNKNIKEVLK